MKTKLLKLLTLCLTTIAVMGTPFTANATETDGKIAEASSSETGEASAEEVFQTFYDAVKHIETDPNWSDFLMLYEVTVPTASKDYVNIVGGTEEEWIALNLFDRFIYSDTYLIIQGKIGTVDYNYYLGNKENYINHGISTTYNSMKSRGEAEAEAYKTLMLWQWDYLQTHGAAYDFIAKTDRMNVSITGTTEETKEPETMVVSETEIQQEIQNALTAEEQQDISEALNATDKNDDKEIESDTIDPHKNNIFTIVILFALVGAVLGVFIYKKSRTQGNNHK